MEFSAHCITVHIIEEYKKKALMSDGMKPYQLTAK